jgi:hypothetical protein
VKTTHCFLSWYETGNYKYSAGICRGFLDFETEKDLSRNVAQEVDELFLTTVRQRTQQNPRFA